jgi:RNA polymerase sigma-70 factor (ECF subfamily)
VEAAEHRFDRLWGEHAGAVLRYAYQQVPRHEVDDVVAETFAVAWRRLDEVPDRALPWLLGVARGVAANARRAGRRRDALHLRVVRLPSAEVPDVAEIVDAQLDEAAAAALGRLSLRDRELLTLTAWQGLSPAEAADVLGCSRSTVNVRLHRARSRFRSCCSPPRASGPLSAPAPSMTDPQPTAPEVHDEPPVRRHDPSGPARPRGRPHGPCHRPPPRRPPRPQRVASADTARP